MYTAPDGGSVDLNLSTAYSAPDGGSVLLNFGSVGVDVFEIDATTDDCTSVITISQYEAPNYANSNSAAGIRLPYRGQGAQDRQLDIVWADTPPLDDKLVLTYHPSSLLDHNILFAWRSIAQQDHGVSLNYHTAINFNDVRIIAAWRGLDKLDDAKQFGWDGLAKRDHAVSVVYEYPVVKDIGIIFSWLTTLPARDVDVSFAWNVPPPKDLHHTTQWGRQAYERICLREYRIPDGNNIKLNLDTALPGANYAPAFNFSPLSYDLRCTQREPGGWYDVYPTYPMPDPYAGGQQNLIQEVYIIMNSVAVVKLPERTPIALDDLNLSIDQDSWAWQLTASVTDENDMAIIEPDGTGAKLIEITINGYVWEFIVEDDAEVRVFGKKAWRITGRSQTAYLSAPYQLAVSYEESTLKTNQQLAEQELASIGGWVINWNTTIYNVTAGAYSYANKSPIQAINMLAGAIGAVILPARAGKSLSVNAKYQYSPWDWAATTPKETITTDVIDAMSRDWQQKPLFDGVYVSGTTMGVNCFVKRTGSAGTTLAEEAVDALITHQDAGRERGRNILSDRGNQRHTTISIPLMPLGQLPGLFEPGDLVEVSDAGLKWKAGVRSVQIAAKNKGANVGQQVQLERHYE